MPDTLVETIGSASANTFGTQAEADTYFDNRLNVSDWTGADSDDKDRALLQAAIEMCLMAWKGTRVDSTQALCWPRDEVVNPDLPWASQEPQDSYYYETTEMPDRIKHSQFELALEMLKAGTTDILARDSLLDVKRKKTDVLETEYFEAYKRARTILEKYPRVYKFIGPLLDSTATAGALDIIRT